MALSEQAAAEVQELAWKMADDAISAEDARRLEDLLLEDSEARLLYVQCMQLQADLHLFFNPTALMMEPPVGNAPGSPASIAHASGSPVLTPIPVLKNLPTIGPSSTPSGV